MITLKGITKRFGAPARQVVALDGVDLTLHAGEFIALTGASGSGKTTLLNVLGLLEVPASGSYRLFDRELVGATEAQLARLRRGDISFVFQGFNLLRELTVVENVELPLLGTTLSGRARRDRVREVLELVGLADRSRSRPGQLSGGQQQRAAIARALVAEPKLLLADEPTGDLDPAAEIDVLDLLVTLGSLGTTIVMATHSELAASLTSRRLVMQAGRLLSG